MKTNIFKYIICLLILVGSFIACEENEHKEKVCGVNNPLTDLPWLKDIVDELEERKYKPQAKIYQCTYKDGTGFLLNLCMGCPDYGFWQLRSCDGETLCPLQALAVNPCTEEKELDVDFENIKLIWEIESNVTSGACEFDNPLEDLPWLKATVDNLSQSESHVKIYQCTYKGGTGFLLDLCVGCHDAGLQLKSCEGESLCLMYGFSGNPCTEFEVDVENSKLIWEIHP